MITNLVLLLLVFSICTIIIVIGPQIKWVSRKSGKLLILSVKLPSFDRFSNSEKTRNLFKAFKSLKTPFAAEIAVPFIGKSPRFSLIFPKFAEAKIKNNILKIWPNAEIKEVDGDVFRSQDLFEGAYISKNSIGESVKKSNFLPILNYLSKLKFAGEGSALQIVCQFKSENPDIFPANIRLIASSFDVQNAKNLLAKFASAVKGVKIIKSRDQNFLADFTEYKYNIGQEIELNADELVNFFVL